jgi:hypothetical protein
MKIEIRLLQQAARGAGIGVDWNVRLDRSPEPPMFRLTGTHDYWNPLVDDRDALALAVMLRMRLHIDDYGAAARITDAGRWHGCEAMLHDGIEAATRRAIVAAAAARGEAIE